VQVASGPSRAKAVVEGGHTNLVLIEKNRVLCLPHRRKGVSSKRCRFFLQGTDRIGMAGVDATILDIMKGKMI